MQLTPCCIHTEKSKWDRIEEKGERESGGEEESEGEEEKGETRGEGKKGGGR